MNIMMSDFVTEDPPIRLQTRTRSYSIVQVWGGGGQGAGVVQILWTGGGHADNRTTHPLNHIIW